MSSSHDAGNCYEHSPVITPPLTYGSTTFSPRSVRAYYRKYSATALFSILSDAFFKGYLTPVDKAAVGAYDAHSGFVAKLRQNFVTTDTIDADFSVDWNGRSCVHYLALLGDMPRLQAFLASGADVNAKDRNHDTALTLVASEGMLNVAKALLAAGADINAQDAGGMSALMCVVVHGHLRMVELLINHGADVDLRSVCGDTALLLAVARGRKDIVEVLLDAGADVNVVNTLQMTTLLLAVENADVNMVALLLRACANVNAPVNSFTPLMMAAYHGDVAVATALLHANANCYTTADGESALMQAERNGHTDVVQLLYSAMDVALPPTTQSTSLTSAATPGTSSALAATLTETQVHKNCATPTHTGATTHADTSIDRNTSGNTGSIIDEPTPSPYTPTSTAMQRRAFTPRLQPTPPTSAPTSVRRPVVKLSLSTPSSPTSTATRLAVHARGSAPKLATVCGYEATAPLDTNDDSEFDESDDEAEEDELDETTPSAMYINRDTFAHACSSGDVITVKYALAMGLHANTRLVDNTPALHVAAACGQARVVKALVTAKADVAAVNRDGKSALQLAGARGHTAVVHALLPYTLRRSGQPQLPVNGKSGGLTITKLTKACASGQSVIVEAALRVDVPVDAILGDDGFSMLMHACEKGQLEVMQILISANADLNMQGPQGTSPLLLAARNGHMEAMRLLLDAKASPNAVTGLDEHSALMTAVEAGAEDMVRVLMRAKAD